MKLAVQVSLYGGLGLSCAGCCAAQPGEWKRVASPHFEVYSQSGTAGARAALAWFEQLRAFFDANGLTGGGDLNLDKRPGVRVIGFSSQPAYDSFRLRGTADAYYVGTEARDYIVMPSLKREAFGMASHEYAHLVLHSTGRRLPMWLSEGLAEFFSTLQRVDENWVVGGELPMRMATLRHRRWLPLRELLDETSRAAQGRSREEAALFYAESWAITTLLISSEEYGPRFRELMATLSAGTNSVEALHRVYGSTVQKIEQDCRALVSGNHFRLIRRPAGTVMEGEWQAADVSEFQAGELLAGLLAADGETARAEEMYREMARRDPESPNPFAALGTIALRRGDRKAAAEAWQKALNRGTNDAELCYRYAVLAEDAGMPAEETRDALERAVALRKDFDDARYKLGLLYNGAGEFEAGLTQLQAMREPTGARAFTYWTAVANTLTELGRREEAVEAAGHAMKHAQTAEERIRAAQLVYVAKTDLTVQFARDASGQMQLVTTRVPHGTTDFNPFIEPGDRIRKSEANLREVLCDKGRLTGFILDAPDGELRLAVPDPMHVLMRNGPGEFNCGVQSSDAMPVQVEYAVQAASTKATGTLRGMKFRARQ